MVEFPYPLAVCGRHALIVAPPRHPLSVSVVRPTVRAALRPTGVLDLCPRGPSHSQVSRPIDRRHRRHEAERRTAPAVHGSGRTRWRVRFAVTDRCLRPASTTCRRTPKCLEAPVPQRVRHRTARCNCGPCRKSSSAQFASSGRITRPASSTCRPTTTCPWSPRSPRTGRSAFKPSRSRARNSTARMTPMSCFCVHNRRATPGMIANNAGR